MIELLFNGQAESIDSVENLILALNRFDQRESFELWLIAPNGSSMCMLRNGANAWLMYLRHSEDIGFTSAGDPARSGSAEYVLSNGQVDEYPLSQCIDLETCYKAVGYYFVNDGQRPEFVDWKAS